MRISGDTIFDATCTTDTFGEVVSINHLYGYSVTADWTVNSPVTGAYVYLLCSNDPKKPLVDWTPVANSANSITTDTGCTWNVWQTFYSHFCVVVVLDSGSVTLTARFSAKGN